MHKLLTILSLSALLSTNILYASEASGTLDNTKYQLCFTPSNGACTKLIINQINQAKKSIDLQAYVFTSKPIADAIIKADKRGVSVTPILDKSDIKNKYSVVQMLTNANIPIWIDYGPNIAHNKVIIIDNQTVVTGSFNWTKSAEYKNSENVLIIHNAKLANQYEDNFKRRKSESIILPKYCQISGKCSSWWEKIKSASNNIYENVSDATQSSVNQIKDWINNN